MLRFFRWIFGIKTVKPVVESFWTGRFFEIKYPETSPLWLFNVLNLAEEVVRDKRFKAQIEAIDHFEFTNDSGVMVMKNLTVAQSFYQTVGRRANPFSKVTASTDVYGHVAWNTGMNPRDLISMLKTAIHERFHSVGYKHLHGASGSEFDLVSNIAGHVAQMIIEEAEDR